MRHAGHRLIMGGNPRFDLANSRQRLIPPPFQFAGDQPVRRVYRVILAERAIGGSTSGLEIAAQRLAQLVAPFGFLGVGLHSCGNRPGSTTFKIAASMASSTRKPPNAMQRGSPSSHRPRVQL